MPIRPGLRRYLQRLVPGLLVVAAGLMVASGLWRPTFIERLDAMFYDARLRTTLPQTIDERIVIIDIDEASLAELGRWPWSRHHMAQLVDTLFDEQGIVALGFDVVFAEPDNSSGLSTLRSLAEGELRDHAAFQRRWPELAQSLDYDQRFADALRERPVVMGYYFTSDRQGHRSGQLPPPAIDPSTREQRPFASTQWNGYGSNIPALASAAPHAGFFNPIVDPDGVVRSVPLLAAHEGRYYTSLGLELYRLLLDSPPVGVRFPDDGSLTQAYPFISHIALGSEDDAILIPVDQRAAVMVPFRSRGGPDSRGYIYLSAADVMAGRLPPGMLEGTIAIVGTTAPGLLDLRSTPVSETYPGVEVHANVLSGLLDGHLPIRPDYVTGIDITQVLLSGLLLAACLPAAGVWTSLALTLLTLGGLVALNGWLQTSHALVVPVATALLTTVALFTLNIVYGYFVETRSKRNLAQLFGSYVPPELVEEMVKEPERYSMAAQDRELTVMFSDMRGFTQLSEHLSPKDLQHLLNRLFSRLSVVIRQQNGTIDKFMGDCVMAFWGAPVASPEHARLAVQAALAMRQVMVQINEEHAREGLPAIGMGVGIHTGHMLVGDMGSDLRRSYTVIGDAVNLGSRLEGLSKVYGVDIVASDATRQQAGSEWVWQELDKVQVKGKEEAVTIHTLWGRASDLSDSQSAALSQWDLFLVAYRARCWQEATDRLEAYCLNGAHQALYQHYQALIQNRMAHPPPEGWDGTTHFDTK